MRVSAAHPHSGECGYEKIITCRLPKENIMDAIPDLAEQDSADMRQDIDTTRTAMADKLEALEDRMMGAARSAQATVEDSIQSAKDAVASVKRTFDIKHQVEQRPWTMFGGSVLAGLAVGLLIPKGPSRPAKDNGQAAALVPVPRLQAEPLPPPSVLEPFREEIDKVKGIAIGYVMGLVRDSVKESAPQMASQIDDLMNGLTTKLGGKPVAARSL
jgi:ElaB/YqjD/DUF883 family membrane-anchored ribosome-binding protein